MSRSFDRLATFNRLQGCPFSMTGQCAGGMASLDRQMKTKMGHKDFVVEDRSDGKGLGVYTRKSYVSGDLIAVLHGEVIAEPHLHSLQITPDRHLYDPDFTGCLLHSCNPNAVILPEKLEIWAVKAIAAGDAITVDYATTEDRLVKQFPCGCGDDICRRWIKGRKEKINEAGQAYLSKF